MICVSLKKLGKLKLIIMDWILLQDIRISKIGVWKSTFNCSANDDASSWVISTFFTFQMAFSQPDDALSDNKGRRFFLPLERVRLKLSCHMKFPIYRFLWEEEIQNEMIDTLFYQLWTVF